MFNPKKGQIVKVCYDGKICRAVKGEILQRRGFVIQVKFKRWNEDTEVTMWFKRITNKSFGGYLRTSDSLMNILFDDKCPGDWYSVYK